MDFPCSSTVYFSILDNNKVMGTVIAFNSCRSVSYVFGAGQSELSVMNDKISSFNI